MKKIFTLLTAALVTLTSFAGHKDGRITIFDYSRKQLFIEVDGIRYNNRDRELVLDNLNPGNHTVQVYTYDRYSDWRGVFDRYGRKQYLFNSVIFVKPRHEVFISINRNGLVNVDERKMRRGRDRDWDDDDRDYRDRDRDYRDRDRDWDRNRDDRNDRFDPTRSAMDARSFEMLKGALGRENFEKSRLEIAKNTIDRNNFSTMQVRELALLFAFESNKLELAKYAYHKTIDRNNFYLVYDVFSFSSSKEELANYIRRVN
jgi:hypothetical protein